MEELIEKKAAFICDIVPLPAAVHLQQPGGCFSETIGCVMLDDFSLHDEDDLLADVR